MFSKQYRVRLGKIVKKLGFRFIGFGTYGWRWNNVYFSDFTIDRGSVMNPHIVIVGESGGGKSNATKIIIERLFESGANIVMLDPHNEYLGTAEEISAEIYDAAHSGINLFDLDGMSERERASEITGMLKRTFRLGEVQGYTLYKCIMKTYSYHGQFGKVPNIGNLLFTISAFKKTAKTSEKSILESLEKRLSVIDTGSFSKSTDMDKVISGNSLFLLSGLHTPEAQAIYLEGFLRKVYSKMLTLEKTGHPFLYIVIDEAEKLGDNPVLGKIAAEGRKYGIGVIATSQRSKTIDKDLRNNSSILISFYQREPEELNYISNFIAGGNELGRFVEVKKGIRNLQRGYAIVMDSGSRNPYIAHFDRYERRNTSIKFSLMQLTKQGILQHDLEEQMVKVCELPDLHEELNKMLAKKEIQQYFVKGGPYLGMWYISNPRNSAEHDICVGIISRHLSKIGVHNKIYNSSYGPDVIAFSNKQRIALEYETGLKNINETKLMIDKRLQYYPKVITIVNDNSYVQYANYFGNTVRFSEIEKLPEIINAA